MQSPLPKSQSMQFATAQKRRAPANRRRSQQRQPKATIEDGISIAASTASVDSLKGRTLADIGTLSRLQLQIDALQKIEYQFALKQLRRNRHLKKLEIRRTSILPNEPEGLDVQEEKRVGQYTTTTRRVGSNVGRRSIKELHELCKVVKSLKSLEELYLNNIGGQEGGDDEELDLFYGLIKSLPRLGTVQVRTCNGRVPHKIQKALTCVRKLRVVVLHVTESIPISTLLTGCRNLEELYVSSLLSSFEYKNCHMIETIQALPRAKNLRILDLGRPTLSASSMISLAVAIEERTLHSNLKTIRFTYDPNVATDSTGINNSGDSDPSNFSITGGCDIINSWFQGIFDETPEWKERKVNNDLVVRLGKALKWNNTLEVFHNYASQKVIVSEEYIDAMIHNVLPVNWKLQKFDFFQESEDVTTAKHNFLRHKVIPYDLWKQYVPHVNHQQQDNDSKNINNNNINNNVNVNESDKPTDTNDTNSPPTTITNSCSSGGSNNIISSFFMNLIPNNDNRREETDNNLPSWSPCGGESGGSTTQTVIEDDDDDNKGGQQCQIWKEGVGGPPSSVAVPTSTVPSNNSNFWNNFKCLSDCGGGCGGGGCGSDCNGCYSSGAVIEEELDGFLEDTETDFTYTDTDDGTYPDDDDSYDGRKRYKTTVNDYMYLRRSTTKNKRQQGR